MENGKTNKVIIYGVGNIEVRRWIEFFLDDAYEVIGYSDTFETSDYVDGKCFIKRDHIIDYEFDYIIIAVRGKEARNKIRIDLRRLGISEEKIVFPYMMDTFGIQCKRNNLFDAMEKYSKKNQYRGVLLGSSTSLSGIDKTALKYSFYDASLVATDFYYLQEILKYVVKHELFKEAEYGLLTLQYWMFDYDMSQSSSQYENGYIFQIAQIGDYHNAHKARNYTIEMYIHNYGLFGTKMRKMCAKEPIQQYNTNHIINQDDNEMEKLHPAWQNRHEQIEIENINIFVELISILQKYFKKTAIIVTPSYTAKLDEKQRSKFNERKEFFYRMIKDNRIEIPIYDYCEEFNDYQLLFRDGEHLNYEGAKRLSERINNDIIG